MNNVPLTPELLEKAKNAKTPEELLAIAKENGVEIMPEQAKVVYAQLHPESGELADEELGNVSGGGCDDTKCPQCNSKNISESKETYYGGKLTFCCCNSCSCNFYYYGWKD